MGPDPLKGICTVCGENVTLRKDGTVRAHGYLKNGESEPKTWCPGAGQDPRQTSDGAFSALCRICSRQTVAIVWVDDKWESLCARDAREALK